MFIKVVLNWWYTYYWWDADVWDAAGLATRQRLFSYSPRFPELHAALLSASRGIQGWSHSLSWLIKPTDRGKEPRQLQLTLFVCFRNFYIAFLGLKWFVI